MTNPAPPFPPAAVDLFRQAVSAQSARWHAEDELEKLLGREVLNGDEIIKDYTDYGGLDDSVIQEALGRLKLGGPLWDPTGPPVG